MVAEGTYWNPEQETLPRAQIEALQWQRLRSQMRYAYANSSLHRRVWGEAGVSPEDVRTWDDFQKRVPFIDKDTVRRELERTGDAYGGMCAAKSLEVITTSSGTTGLPTFLPLTGNDIANGGEQFARMYWGMGLRPGQKFHIIIMGWHRCVVPIQVAAERIGATRVRMDIYPLPPEITRNYHVAKHLRPDFVHFLTVPMIDGLEAEARKDGLSPRDVFSCYKGAVLTGDVISPRVRARIDEGWGGRAYEVGGLGDLNFYCGECAEHDGLHSFDDMFLFEIVDPQTKEVLPPGERGVLVISALVDEALPAIRWWTEDVGYLDPTPCRCGRTSTRVHYLGRQQYGVTVAGRQIFPSQLYAAIAAFDETSHALFQIVKYAPQMATLRLRLGYQPGDAGKLAELGPRITARVAEELGFATEVEFVPTEELLALGPPHKIPRLLDLTKGHA